MTTTAATVENLEKAIHKKLKVLQLLNENSNKIAENKFVETDSKTLRAYGAQS